MLRSFVVVVALSLCTAGTAAAQTDSKAAVAVSYQFATVSSTSTLANVPPVTTLTRGFDVAIAGRVHPLVSIVGRFGMNFAPTVTVPTSGISGSSEFGTVSYHVSDWAGGVKLGHAGTSARTKTPSTSSTAMSSTFGSRPVW
jgi:hypothetical protein